MGALVTKENIARRICDFRTSCDICDNLEDSDTHALFDCPLVTEIWRESELEDKFCRSCPLAAVDSLLMAVQSLDKHQLGEFVAVMWEVWNERNRVVFGQGVVGWKKQLVARAVQFMRSYNDFKGYSSQMLATRDKVWTPPDIGIHKLNFDAVKVGVNCHGWGFAIRNYLGDVVLAGVKQGVGFSTPEIEEPSAFLLYVQLGIMVIGI